MIEEEQIRAMLLFLLANAAPPLLSPTFEPDEGQVKKALAIVKPRLRSPELLSECRDDITSSLALIHGESPLASRSKENRKSLEQLLAALKRARAAQEGLTWSDSRRLNNMLHWLPTAINYCERELKQPSRKPRPSSDKQRNAILAARNLLLMYTDRDEAVFAISRNSLWHRLSQALFGEDVELLRYMSARRKITRRYV